MSKKNDFGAPKGALKVAGSEPAGELPGPVFTMDMVLGAAQRLANFEAQRWTQPTMSENTRDVSSLATMRIADQKNPVRLRQIPKDSAEDKATHDNVETFSSEGRRPKAPSSGSKGQ